MKTFIIICLSLLVEQTFCQSISIGVDQKPKDNVSWFMSLMPWSKKLDQTKGKKEVTFLDFEIAL